jgi:hypothetical protein
MDGARALQLATACRAPALLGVRPPNPSDSWRLANFDSERAPHARARRARMGRFGVRLVPRQFTLGESGPPN